MTARHATTWPLWLLAAPAFVAIWSGWVGLGTMTGFGVVRPLPGLWDDLRLDSRALLPVGVEAYAALALRAWLDRSTPPRARTFARRSAVASLVLGAGGQVLFHLMTAAGLTHAPWPVTAAVACLPVAVLGMGAALAHLLRDGVNDASTEGPRDQPATVTPRPSPVVVLADEICHTHTKARVAALVTERPGVRSTEVAALLGVSARTARRHLSTLRARDDDHTTGTSAGVPA